MDKPLHGPVGHAAGLYSVVLEPGHRLSVLIHSSAEA